ncbi:MAG TPA: amidohydrolase family protein [Vicinamibacterales bacterium]|nr:amidohydrolase family protein [Vicinamibacterales bacterium]
MAIFKAAWILPVSAPPIRGGWVALDGDRIAATGATDDPAASDLGSVAVMPALVNAHTHLELSFLHERVPPGKRFNEWVESLMAVRREYTDPHDSTILDAARRAILQARAAGTGLFGDVGNSLVTVALLRDAGVAAQVFYELIGFNVAEPDRKVSEARAGADAAGAGGDVRVSIAPHAPYSVSPALFGAIRRDLDARRTVSSVHLGESKEEIELLRHGTGAVRHLLERLGVWTETWRPPGSSPVEYLTSIGFLDSRVLVVHGVQFDGDDLRRLRAMGITLVSCPRSNRYVGVGSPPLEAFYAMDVRVAFGTDSLASVADLNLFAELAEARRIAPRVPARALLDSATLTAAEALGFGEQFGSIEPGKRASLLAVRVPADLTDVEEYLVSGAVGPDDITWIAV